MMRPALSLRRGWTGRHGRLLGGVLILVPLLLLALLSTVWTPFPPAKMQILHKLQPPLAFGLLGTDQLGRDLLSMLMVGILNSLTVAIGAVAVGSVAGIAAGLLAAGAKGPVEALLMRICDIVFAVPPILSAMMLGAFLGSGRGTAIAAIGIFMVPVFARVSLTAARQAWSRDYTLAAIAIGRSRLAITLHHILPNIAGPLVVQAAIQLGLAVLTEAGLGFLGLSLAPPAPSLGRMLSDSQTFLMLAPWLAVLPGATIALCVMGFNLLGDGLRDLMDPRAQPMGRR